MSESSSNQPASNTMTSDKPPVGGKLFSLKKKITSKKIPENPVNDEDMMTIDFDSDGGSSSNINCNVVSVLSH